MDTTNTSVSEEVTIVKKGTELLHMELRRCAKGLKVNVKAHESLEAWIKELSDPRLHPPADLGDGGIWLDAPLEVYRVTNNAAIQQNTVQPFWRADRWGHPLDCEGYVNLSFLRARGVSGEEGISFIVKGVFSADKIRKIAESYRQAVRNLYCDFVRPVCFSVSVQVAQEL